MKWRLSWPVKGGERLPVLVNAYERRDQNGDPQFIRLTVYKATDRWLYEENLRYARTVFELSVSNGGKPVSPEALEGLFQPFTRENVRSSQNGLGLGLYIASETARAQRRIDGCIDGGSNPLYVSHANVNQPLLPPGDPRRFHTVHVSESFLALR